NHWQLVLLVSLCHGAGGITYKPSVVGDDLRTDRIEIVYGIVLHEGIAAEGLRLFGASRRSVSLRPLGHGWNVAGVLGEGVAPRSVGQRGIDPWRGCKRAGAGFAERVAVAGLVIERCTRGVDHQADI